ncbi:MAG: hypothetical protein QE271_05190 [Bacteriovoracaceae bacterium]|nr:hypothetical protein [Bacteriovoracaceae bacterium]
MSPKISFLSLFLTSSFILSLFQSITVASAACDQNTLHTVKVYSFGSSPLNSQPSDREVLNIGLSNNGFKVANSVTGLIEKELDLSISEYSYLNILNNISPKWFSTLNGSKNGFFKLAEFVSNETRSEFYARYSVSVVWENNFWPKELTIIDVPLSSVAIESNRSSEQNGVGIKSIAQSNSQILSSAPSAKFIQAKCGQTDGQISFLN